MGQWGIAWRVGAELQLLYDTTCIHPEAIAPFNEHPAFRAVLYLFLSERDRQSHSGFSGESRGL